MFKKVIASHQGELTAAILTVGDVVRYRIYFDRPLAISTELSIVDRLDRGLTRVTPFNGGSYDRRTHTVTWRLDRLPRLRTAYVEFEARIAIAGSIVNQAQIGARGHRPRKSNEVLVRAVARPPAGWIALDGGGEAGAPPVVYMKDETSMGLTVNFQIAGVQVHEAMAGGVLYHRVSIPERATRTKVGQPQVPVAGALVEVPHGVSVNVGIVKSAHKRLAHYNIYPAQEPVARQAPREGDLAIDGATYRTDAFYPGDLATVEVEDIGVMRGHRVVFLKVNPVQFNPVTRELDVYSNIEVQVRFDKPGQIEKVSERLVSPAFETMLQHALLNYKQPERFAREGDYQHEVNGCHYLILTHPDFYNASDVNSPVVRLQSWKRKKGLITRVTDVTGITGGNTAAAIRDYIQDAYDTWYPAPTYVLLVGDDERIPTNTGLLHPGHPPDGPATPIGTDLDYSTLDGTDYFPDLFLGRLPASTRADATTMVDKIIDYEQTPPNATANPGYYTDTSLVCLFEDYHPPLAPSVAGGEGTEDDTFRIVEFAEAIRTHLRGAGYNVERIYARSGVHPAGPERYENGADLPDELTLAGDPGAGIPGFPWSGATGDIRAAFANGRFLITFNGHGGRQSWGNPGFTAPDARGLTNGALTPVVFSFACQTGWFDNATDAASLGTSPTDEALSEELLTNASGGAVGVIGATRNSWQQNDFMMLGAYRAVWPAFEPNPPSSLPLPDLETGPLPRLGQILQFSKTYMANVYPHSFNRESSFEMYHLFGDPEMPIWTAPPREMTVSHPDGVGATGEQQFVVKVVDLSSGDPVRSAAVTLTRRVTTGGDPLDRILETLLTGPEGIARFTLTDIGAGDIEVTVTALGYLPHSSTIAVAADGAVLTRLDPPDGTVGQTVHVAGANFQAAEAVDVLFDGSLVATTTCVGGAFGTPGTDVTFAVPAGQPLGPVNVGARGAASGRHASGVFHVRTANPIDLWQYSQWDPSTWHLHAGGSNPIWNSPDIVLYDSAGNPVDSNNLRAGTTYDVKVRVRNDTAFQANQASVVFRWANFGIGGPFFDFETRDVDVLPGGTDAEAPFTPAGTGHLCVQAEVFHAEDVATLNNKGQENLHVGPTSSPAKVCFEIWNTSRTPAAVFIEVRQLVPADRIGREPLWATQVIHPDRQVLRPGEKAEACVAVDPKYADVPQGAKAAFAVTGFIEGRMIGGVNLVIERA